MRSRIYMLKTIKIFTIGAWPLASGLRGWGIVRVLGDRTAI